MKSLYVRKDYTVAEVAYLAGIIDGEGSIYIGCFSKNPKTGTPHYQTNIEVSNTSRELTDWLVKVFGGHTSDYTPNQTPKNSRRHVYRWKASGDRVLHICELIMPYVTIKRRQCEIMIAMRKTYEQTHMQKGQQGTQPIELEVLAMRELYYQQMRSLHCRNYLNK